MRMSGKGVVVRSCFGASAPTPPPALTTLFTMTPRSCATAWSSEVGSPRGRSRRRYGHPTEVAHSHLEAEEPPRSRGPYARVPVREAGRDDLQGRPVPRPHSDRPAGNGR